MNVTVFGATGQIGRLDVGDLLAAGHDVAAYVRNPGKPGGRDSRLSTIAGELSDEARIQQAAHRRNLLAGGTGDQQLTSLEPPVVHQASGSRPLRHRS